MSEPLDNNEITFWLEFRNDDSAEVQIDEMPGFDASEFVIQQADKRYGRDVSFSGEEIDLSFPNIAGSRYGYQFDRLIEYDDVYGYESEVIFKLKENGITFVVGQLDYFTKKTDRFNYFDCKVIQETKQQLLKRRQKTDIDLFGTEDLDGNEIDSVQTSSILLEAKPIVSSSDWNSQSFNFYTGNPSTSNLLRTFEFNNFVNINSSEINDTLSGAPSLFLDTFSGDSDLYNKIYDMGKIDSQTNISNISWSLQGVVFSIYFSTSENFSDDWSTNNPANQRPYFRTYVLPQGQDNYTSDDLLAIDVQYIFGEWVDMGLETRSFANGMSGTYKRFDFICDDQTNESNISIPNGYRWTGLFQIERIKTFISVENEGNFSVSATQTAIPSVTNAVRLIDAMNQVNKNLNTELNLTAPRFEQNGEWYDNFVFDGNLIRGRETKFIMNWDDVANLMREFNSDYEISNDSLFCGKYDDFYQPTEIGAFLLSPDETFDLEYNDRYAVNKFTFKYKNYNQDKDDENTIDGMHTEANFSVKNKQVENEKEIEVNGIRDAYLLETTRRKAFESSSSGSSSLSQDNKVFIVDVVDIDDSDTGGFQDTIYHILNSEDDTLLDLLNDGTYNWALLGFQVGDNFVIENTDNADTYTVINIESGTLTLQPQTIVAQSLQLVLTDVSYQYTSVDYKIRTNQGFDSITGVASPESYANLLYTPKRNILNNYSSYLATCVLYNDKDVSIQSFINEPTLVTQYNGGDVITENSNITQEELSTPLLSARVIKTKVICDFSTYKSYASALQSERGFVRVYDNNGRIRRGYPMESRYSWKDHLLELTLEEFYENELLQISFDYDTESYIINRAGYPQAVLPDLEYQVEGDYIQLLDQLNRPLSAKYKYDKVIVQGETYDNIVDLSTSISIL